MRDSLLSSKDTTKYTKAQLEVKRNELGKVYVELQGWNQKVKDILPEVKGPHADNLQLWHLRVQDLRAKLCLDNWSSFLCN